jgi:hypothetical protein
MYSFHKRAMLQANTISSCEERLLITYRTLMVKHHMLLMPLVCIDYFLGMFCLLDALYFVLDLTILSTFYVLLQRNHKQYSARTLRLRVQAWLHTQLCGVTSQPLQTLGYVHHDFMSYGFLFPLSHVYLLFLFGCLSCRVGSSTRNMATCRR